MKKIKTKFLKFKKGAIIPILPLPELEKNNNNSLFEKAIHNNNQMCKENKCPFCKAGIPISRHKMKIIQVDPIYCKVDPASDFLKIKKLFEYESIYWQQGAYKKTPKKATSCLANHPHKGWLLAGFIPKIKQYCLENNIPFEFESFSFDEKIKQIEPSLPGITFREEQLNLVQIATKGKRGIIKSPTGSGKTVLAGGVISQFPTANCIFIVHTSALFSQTIEEFQKWFENVGWIGNGEYNPRRITVCMIQSINKILIKNKTTKKYEHEKYQEFADLLSEQHIIIVDEAHHLCQQNGHYIETMEHCLAEIRIGFTATTNPPKNKTKEALVGEGYLGPVIGEFTLEEGIEKGILAKPRLKLIPVPFNADLSNSYKKSYPQIYKHGIILNKQRNRLIAKEAALTIDQNKSVLIMITDVVHGHAIMIQEILLDVYGHKSFIVNGGTKIDLREEIKGNLKSKNIKCVIVTNCWSEGINIPSLDNIILAAGGKSDIRVLQSVGRGLRTSEGKEEILITDFLDPYPYLAQHSIERLRVYHEMGILNN